ncbi:MAG TPA: DUF4349 domain-containing protein [Clostridia bacterium]|nr:DUF4349 domain-containing protein [Clostridia bacterium]
MKRYLSFALVLLLLLFAGCAASAPNEATYDSAASEPQAAPAPDSLRGSGEAEDEKPKGAAESQTDLPDYGGHKIIRTFSVSFETDTFDSDLSAITKSAMDMGGYVESSQVNGRKPEVYSDAGRNAYLTLRIPAEKADEFVEGVKGYGTLISANENAKDVTEAYFDLETRLEVLHTQLDRLKSILVTTDNLADIIALEKEIADVTLQIEQFTTEVRRYDGLISYATVTVSIEELRLNEGPAAQATVGERIDRGFTDTLYGVGTFFVNLFVFLVSALPVLVVLGVIALIVVLIVRGSQKRRKKKEESVQAFTSNKEGNKDDK